MFEIVFDCVDTDNTHTISLEEMQVFIADMDHIFEMRNDENLPEEIQDLLEAADKNNDGKLTQIEIIKALNENPQLKEALANRKAQVQHLMHEASHREITGRTPSPTHQFEAYDDETTLASKGSIDDIEEEPNVSEFISSPPSHLQVSQSMKRGSLVVLEDVGPRPSSRSNNGSRPSSRESKGGGSVRSSSIRSGGGGSRSASRGSKRANSIRTSSRGRSRQNEEGSLEGVEALGEEGTEEGGPHEYTYEDIRNELVAYVQQKRHRKDRASIWTVGWGADINTEASMQGADSESPNSKAGLLTRRDSNNSIHSPNKHAMGGNTVNSPFEEHHKMFPPINKDRKKKQAEGANVKFEGNGEKVDEASEKVDAPIKETKEERRARLKEERIKRKKQNASSARLSNLEFRSTRKDTLDAKILTTMHSTPGAVPTFFPPCPGSHAPNNDYASSLSRGGVSLDGQSTIHTDYHNTYPSATSPDKGSEIYSISAGDFTHGDKSILTGMSTSSNISYDKVKVVKVDKWGTDRTQAARRRARDDIHRTMKGKKAYHGGSRLQESGPIRHKPQVFAMALANEHHVREAGINLQFKASVLSKSRGGGGRSVRTRHQVQSSLWSDNDSGGSLESPVRGSASTAYQRKDEIAAEQPDDKEKKLNI